MIIRLNIKMESMRFLQFCTAKGIKWQVLNLKSKEEEHLQ